MRSDALFEILGDMDDTFILEAEEDAPRRIPWKIIGAAAAAAVVIGTVWFSARMLSRPAPVPAPPELAAPVVSTDPGVPDTPDAPDVSPEPGETTAPTVPTGPDVPYETPVPDDPSSDPVPDIPDVSAQPVDPDDHSDDPSGQGLPGWGGSGWGGAGGSGSSGSLPGLPSLPGMGGAAVPFKGAYYHSAAGDYLVFRSPVLGVPVVTVNITGQIINGHYEGTVSIPFAQSFYVELQVHDDGTYDLIY